MTRMLFENWPQKLLAILIAFLLWVFVIRTGPKQPRARFANVPYQELNLPEGLRVTEGPTTIEIEARALIDPTVLDKITVEDIKPVVDLSSARPGVGEYPVQIPKTRFATEVQLTPRPGKVTLRIERYIESKLPVDVEQIGDGPLLAGSDWTLSNAMVTIKGVESIVQKAKRAIVRIDQGAIRPGQSYQLPVLILDAAASTVFRDTERHSDVRTAPRSGGLAWFCAGREQAFQLLTCPRGGNRFWGPKRASQHQGCPHRAASTQSVQS